MQTLLYYPSGAVVLLFAAAALYYQRSSSRRAALATLRSATVWASAGKASAKYLARVPTSSSEHSEEQAPSAPPFAVLGALGRLGQRLSPPAYTATRQRRLQLAGKGRVLDQEKFFALRLMTLAAVVPASALELLLPLRGLSALLGFIIIAALLGLGPEALLNHLVSQRQDRIRRDLPALVELLMISVEAGLGFDQALARSVGSVPGPLSEEFSRYLGEVRMGSGHREALEAIDRRTGVDELRSFLMALAQAETFGISIGSILRAQAKESRAAQHQHTQERAQKAPVKMLFPLVFCVLPALFVVVLGPAAIEIYRDLIK